MKPYVDLYQSAIAAVVDLSQRSTAQFGQIAL